MSLIQTCYDTKDTLDLLRAQGLYLKPVSKLNVSVQLPQLKKSGAKISNWEVMEKVKEMGKPFTFPVFKVKIDRRGGNELNRNKGNSIFSGGKILFGVYPFRSRDRKLRFNGSGAGQAGHEDNQVST